MSKQFHIGDVLSITTDYLVSPEGMGGIYKILGYMTNSEPFTHQLPRVAQECKTWLLRQHPGLADADTNSLDTQLAFPDVKQADDAVKMAEVEWRAAASAFHASGQSDETRKAMHEAKKREDKARYHSRALREGIILAWLQWQAARFGEYLDVEPIPADDHARRDPVEEAEQMFGADRVIVVDPNA